MDSWAPEDAGALLVLVQAATWDVQAEKGTTLFRVQKFCEARFPKLRAEFARPALEAGLARMQQQGVLQVRTKGLRSGLLQLQPGYERPSLEVMAVIAERFASAAAPEEQEVMRKGLLVGALAATEDCWGTAVHDDRVEEALSAALGCEVKALRKWTTAAQHQLVQEGRLRYARKTTEGVNGNLFAGEQPGDAAVQEARARLRAAQPWAAHASRPSSPAKAQAAEPDPADGGGASVAPQPTERLLSWQELGGAAPQGAAERSQRAAASEACEAPRADAALLLDVLEDRGPAGPAKGGARLLLDVLEDRGPAPPDKDCSTDALPKLQRDDRQRRLEALCGAVPHNRPDGRLQEAAASHTQQARRQASGPAEQAPRGPGLLPRKRKLRTLDEDGGEEPPPLARGAPQYLSVGQPGKKARASAPQQPEPLVGQQPQQQQGLPGDGRTPLHGEIHEWLAQWEPSAEEQRLVAASLAAVQAAAAAIWPQARAHVFGSQAMGLALRGSDVDIVILGVGRPDEGLGLMDAAEKARAVSHLRQLLQRLEGERLLHPRHPSRLIVNAKVPLCKCGLRPPGFAPACAVDVSWGNRSGVDALPVVRPLLEAMPPARPLVLLLKRWLKEHGLNEVHTGGLSSFSVLQMVIAHLLAEGYAPQPPQPPTVETDLGRLLWGFFARFGCSFDYCDQAVSILRGGITRKRPQWRVRFKPQLLAVESPLGDGREISGGSFRMPEIKALFASAAARLAAALAAAEERQAEAAGWAAVQSDGQHSSCAGRAAAPVLSSILKWP